jgi:hypothetical protein
MKTKSPKKSARFNNVSEAVEYGELTRRCEMRLRMALNDENIKRMTGGTVRALVYACRDPKTSSKEITVSQKVMKYQKYAKLWDNLAWAVRLYDSKINNVKVEPTPGEDCAKFRARYLQAVLNADIR